MLNQLIYKNLAPYKQIWQTHYHPNKNSKHLSPIASKKAWNLCSFFESAELGFQKRSPKKGLRLKGSRANVECLPVFWFTPFYVDIYIYFTSRILANLNLHGNKKHYLSLLRRYTVNISTDSKYVYFCTSAIIVANHPQMI